MENLKFDNIQLTEDGLMYVKFKLGEKELKWFPKWDDLAWLVACSHDVEEKEHLGSWRLFFEIMGLQILIESLSTRLKMLDSESEREISDIFTKLRQTFWRNLRE
ncbi:hypothetical protein ES708_11846 [subsurface metagenome]